MNTYPTFGRFRITVERSGMKPIRKYRAKNPEPEALAAYAEDTARLRERGIGAATVTVEGEYSGEWLALRTWSEETGMTIRRSAADRELTRINEKIEWLQQVAEIIEHVSASTDTQERTDR